MPKGNLPDTTLRGRPLIFGRGGHGADFCVDFFLAKLIEEFSGGGAMTIFMYEFMYENFFGDASNIFLFALHPTPDD